MKSRTILTHDDFRRMTELLDGLQPRDRGSFAGLHRKISQAYRIEPARVPADVVTIGSTILLRELDSGDDWVVTLCLPDDADPDQLRISVLSPLGTAILGCGIGAVVDWPAPAGVIRGRIEEVLFQPEFVSAAADRAVEDNEATTRSAGA